jgi:hypothetical protein
MTHEFIRQQIERLNTELGRPAFSACYEIFVYGTAERRQFQQALSIGIESVERRFETRLRWYKTNTMKLPKAVATRASVVATNYMDSLSAKPPKLAGIQFHSGSAKENYSVPAIAFFSSIVPTDAQDRRKSRSYIRIGVPVDRDDAPALVRDLCREVVVETPLVGAHCGWSFYWSGVDPDEEVLLRLNARAWLKRFKGLTYGDPLAFLEFIGDGLLGVSWLTYVEREAVEARGQSFRTLQDRLRKAPVSTALIEGRILEIQAAPAPELADRNHNEDAKSYRAVGRALSELRLADEQARYLPILGMDQEERADWYRALFESE